jgi:glucose-6-phosphate dehydrogenase assembly protein OpcA
MGMVLSLVVDSDESGSYDAIRAASDAAHEHPSRIIGVIRRPGRMEPRLDAEIRVAGEAGPGEVLLLRLHGKLAVHAESVVLPLLLPDAPVVTWWPGEAPEVPCDEPLGVLAGRRITDAASAGRPLAALAKRSAGYNPGDTDLSWTRLTPWRTLLAAALDEPTDRITGATVEAERSSPSAELLALWLERTLKVDVTRKPSKGPGLTAVRLRTEAGDVALTRPDGRLATFSRPGWPDRPVALHRRSTSELIAEELRHLDPDDVYCDTIALASKKAAGSTGAASKKAGGQARAQAETSAAKATAAATGSGDARPGRSRTRAR